ARSPARPATGGRGPKGTGSKSAGQSGIVATRSAATPESTRFSAHVIPPFPTVRSAPPAMSAATHARTPSRSRRGGEIAKSRPPATRNRAADMRNGGIVRIASMIPRYVEPQTTYSVAKAPQARAVMASGLPATDPAAVVHPTRVGAVEHGGRPDQHEQEDDDCNSHGSRMPTAGRSEERPGGKERTM